MLNVICNYIEPKVYSPTIGVKVLGTSTYTKCTSTSVTFIQMKKKIFSYIFNCLNLSF